MVHARTPTDGAEVMEATVQCRANCGMYSNHNAIGASMGELHIGTEVSGAKSGRRVVGVCLLLREDLRLW